MFFHMKITHEHLLQLLHYDAATGVFTWNVGNNKRGRGRVAGSLLKSGSSRGYLYITVCGSKYRAHRLAWFYAYKTTPPVIDHIDGNKANNALANLRAATQQQNSYNAKLSKLNTSGFKGVCWDKSKMKWMASIRLPCGKQKTIGRYETKEEAAAAFKAVELATRGEFAKNISNPGNTS